MWSWGVVHGVLHEWHVVHSNYETISAYAYDVAAVVVVVAVAKWKEVGALRKQYVAYDVGNVVVVVVAAAVVADCAGDDANDATVAADAGVAVVNGLLHLVALLALH